MAKPPLPTDRRGILARHLHQHARFYVGLGLGLAAWVVAGIVAPAYRLILAGDVFLAAYLLGMVTLAASATPDSLRRRASIEDEGMVLIVTLTVVAIAFCLGSLFMLLAEPGGPEAWKLSLGLLAVPLGWAVLHMIAALHYASIWYQGSRRSGDGRQAGGIAFAGASEADEPGVGDFLYHAFTIGMTAQVSDSQVTSPAMRRLVLAHGLASFLFNTVILALAVNVALQVGGK